MEYKIIDSCQWTYPDIWEYKGEAKIFEGLAVLGGTATFRIIVRDIKGVLNIQSDGIDCLFYEEIAIPVEDNPNFEEGFMPHFPERIAPFCVYDCMKPCNGIVTPKNKITSIYVSIPAACETLNGNIILSCCEQRISIPVSVKAYGKMPEETLKISMGYELPSVAKWHDAEFGSEKLKELDQKYLHLLRHQHQNGYFLEHPRVHKDKNGKWNFNFDFMNHRIRTLLNLGFTHFHLHGIGFRRAWDAPDIIICGMDGLSYDAFMYLSSYLPALRENLRENGWLDSGMFTIGIADEPNQFDGVTYRAIAATVRKYLPEVRIYEAVSYVHMYGAIDVWAPRADEYAKNSDRFDVFKELGDEIWHYVCLFPRVGGYINRFMDIPLLATRYIYWANYKYDLAGYLHWSVNNYQSDLDPYEGSCPVHINAGSKSILPPGDDKLIYPGDNEPYMSARLEAHREAAEEYEMLRVIAENDKETADKLCDACFKSYTNVEFDPVEFRKTQHKLIIEYSKYC
ncbi:MAG: DUF4091 domain-containing protein [Clostridia bacterium]|nr:DUF4091 domain-containing protein [Clostridia bacterium]